MKKLILAVMMAMSMNVNAGMASYENNKKGTATVQVIMPLNRSAITCYVGSGSDVFMRLPDSGQLVNRLWVEEATTYDNNYIIVYRGNKYYMPLDHCIVYKDE